MQSCGSGEAQDFVKEIIDFAIIDYDFEVETPEILNFEQDYRAQMSQAEIAIFDNLTDFQQLRYLHSAYLAKNFAELFYSSSTLYNGKGDAFRHCLWNAFGAYKIGKTLMKQLTDAHEVYDPGEIPRPLEKTMDLHNNQIGLDIGSQYPYNNAYSSIMLDVIIAINEGDTNYIYPTAPNGSVVSGVSQIIPTNQ